MPQDNSTALYPNGDSNFNAKQYPDTSYILHTDNIDAKEPARDQTGLTIFLLFFFGFIIIRILIVAKNEGNNPRPGHNNNYSSGEILPAYKYDGNELNFTKADYKNILAKNFRYYQTLTNTDQEKFIKRINKFICDKIFTLHGGNSFKEMPVLVAASAIQLTFGLDKYLFPHFKYIHIYPEEFLRSQPVLCFLQGNVSGHTIRLSWKHFLHGIENNTDGQDVGLHEMSHALYYQTFVTERHVDRDFRDFFDGFNDVGNKVYLVEQAINSSLYSNYAMQDFQEFWAESVEIFFEKPFLLREKYPDLFNAMKNILNQDLS